MGSSAFKLVSPAATKASLADGVLADIEPVEHGWASLSDEELMALTCKGERDAFRLLVERYELRALHTARGILRRTEVAREAVQEAFLKVYANRDKFDGKRKFPTWFFRILRNHCVDTLRRLKPGTPHGAGELLGDWGATEPGPVAAVSARERRVLVRRILEALPNSFREVLAMRDLEGMSCGDIADAVGTTAGTVRWRLHHARKLFREHWERQLGAEEGSDLI
ncbi:MAG: sigma-70 family RNA polymerase sigma factor [Planctomycetes bacterium]|jgi:RNA polymerase sigma-70 factor (ECF subfamily)|nr:sigma-70 family RNA polymerase sigma factor [Planctomycetota bacterium]MBT4028542.1 sigma-70 family RNA polymerase sigma factor [Planctomycetota bacterium]MBT4559434.1 sigma-70 family RNA polymerase sigma factor [Planctomycetota bacterium]MBT5101003.1 sigma-70 family RNA polymerase sigma factor [Planctomycetota bacterium]MBT7319039.1 sigma-70 family RNA polymerase sigma factor [Planctomycetota bacterium]